MSWIMQLLQLKILNKIYRRKRNHYHRFLWFATFQIKTPVETFPRFPSIIPMAYHIWQYTLSRLPNSSKMAECMKIWRSKGWVTVSQGNPDLPAVLKHQMAFNSLSRWIVNSILRHRSVISLWKKPKNLSRSRNAINSPNWYKLITLLFRR